MKILEHCNGKIIAEIPGKYYTRIVCRADSMPTGELGITKIVDSGWPIRMNTQKYGREMKMRQARVNQQLRQEVAAKLPPPLNSCAVLTNGTIG